MNTKLALLLASALAGLSLSAEARADDKALPRRAELGVAFGPATSEGLPVLSIASPASAKASGLLAGDVLKSIDGAPMTGAEALAPALKAKGGRKVNLAVKRASKAMDLTPRLAAKPYETYEGGEAVYGAVPFEGGRLGDILVAPPGGPKGPVLYIVQGYTCGSIEGDQQSAYRLLAQGLLERGVSTYRVEKAGVGDGDGAVTCSAGDFDAEVKAFEAGYKHLTQTLGVPADRIFIFGHSMGGLEAPLIAGRNDAPRGVAVYGTVSSAWQDYLMRVYRFQAFVSRDADPATGEATGESLREVIADIYQRRMTPRQVVEAHPEREKLLRDWLAWDGADKLYGRTYAYWHGVSALRPLTAWRDVRSDVLSILGEGDVAAMGGGDHEMIVDAVNHYRPGTARFVSVPRTGHGMRLDGSVAQIRAEAREGRTPAAPAAFNFEMVRILGDWIDASMAKPSVATRFAK